MADLVTITVTLRNDGSIGVQGPLDNKILCYGILEAAKLAVRDHKPSQIIQPAAAVV